ncbi:hypothetical protein Trihar35433_6075 [Trichoderma harzianum]|nr:hypothetical protein Trihar35433_6075 [Trichoderma harzianum]
MEDFENIMREYHDIPSEAAPNPDLANLLDNLGEYLWDKFKSTREISYLEKAVEIAVEAIEQTPLYDGLWPRRLHALGSWVLIKLIYSQSLVVDFEETVCVLQGIFDTTSIDATATKMCELLLHMMFSMTGDVAYLDEAINIIRGAIDMTSPNHPDRPTLLSTLEHQLSQRYDSKGEIADIEEAICLGQSLINATAPMHPERGWRLFYLATNFSKRHSSTKDVADLNEAISLLQDASETIPLNDSTVVKFHRGLYLWSRYHCSGETADLEEATYMYFEAVEACPKKEDWWEKTLAGLAVSFVFRYGLKFEIADINAAVIISRESIIAFPIDDPMRSLILKILGGALYVKFRHAGAGADLDEIICITRDDLDSASLDYDIRLKQLIHLADLLNQRYFCTGSQSDIEESIYLMRQTIAATLVDDPNRMDMLFTLVRAFADRFQNTGASRDLDEAIRMGRDSLDANLSTGSNESRLRLANTIGTCLLQRHYRTGAMPDLNESNILMREAIKSAPTYSKNRPVLLQSLGIGLIVRYHRTKATEDLDEAMLLLQESLETATSVYQEQPDVQKWLAATLNERFVRSGEIGDLMEAIAMIREAVSISPKDNLGWPNLLNGLGFYLYEMYQHTGKKSVLDEAIRVCQDAVNASPPADSLRATYLSSLGLYLTSRYTHMKAIADSEKAALAMHLNDPVTASLKMAVIFANLEQHGPRTLKGERISLREGFDSSNPNTEAESLSDLENARQCFLDTLYHEQAGVRCRFHAGHLALTSPDFIHDSRAYDVAKYTTDLIPFLTSHSVQNSDKKRVLASAVGIPSIAAAIALHALPANRGPFAAIECLEIGRGLIGGYLLQQYEVSILKKLHPYLADSFLTLRGQLDMPVPQSLSPLINVAAVNAEVEENEHRKAEQQFAQLLEIIRSRPDFQRFLLPASELDTVRATSDGPIIILNMCSYRCDALIIESSGSRVVELPQLSQGLSSLALINKYSKDFESLETLAWLWDEIVCPVLDALGFTERPADDSWPHVWWIPTGVLTKFPLHAAGHHLRRSGETTLDRVISSYATSVKAIIHSRRREAPIAMEPLSLVAVAMEATEGHMPLIHANREVDAIFNIFESESVDCQRPRPYKDDVLSAIKSCQIFHFAGHGKTHLTDPLGSALLLRDWQNDPLTVASLLEINLSSNPPFLAYLSACGTGQIHGEEYTDESIHLVNAFQLAGFRHVIGTLWRVDDELCVEIAEMTYKSLKGGMRDDLVSRGLHDAMRTLRDRWIDMADGGIESGSRVIDGFREGRHAQLEDDDEELGRPLWIPYVHFGV